MTQHEQLFSDAFYMALSLKGNIDKSIPQRTMQAVSEHDEKILRLNRLSLRLNTPKQRDLNEALLRIYKDAKLKMSIRAYGKPIQFGRVEHPEREYGYACITLQPNEDDFMWATNYESGAIWIDGGDKVEPGYAHYPVYETNGVLHNSYPGVGGSPWHCRSLAKEIIKKDPALTGEKVLQSLEKTIQNLLKGG